MDFLNNPEELEDRNDNFRKLINYKKYDLNYKDNIAKYIINSTKWKDMLLIRYNYAIEQFKKIDMIFYNGEKLYVIEIKSLKDKTKEFSENSKIENCILLSIKHAKLTTLLTHLETIPVSVIEYHNGDIIVNEHTGSFINNQKLSPWINNSPWKIEKQLFTEQSWFDDINDETYTKFKIVGDTLEVERIISYEPTSEFRNLFKKRIIYITQECTKCTKYLIIIKNTQNDIIMQEYYEIPNLANNF